MTPTVPAQIDLIELKPYRQTWLSTELLHSAPSAYLCMIDGEQWAQLEHPKGGPLTCVKNRTGRTAVGVIKHKDKWMWEFAAPKPAGQAEPVAKPIGYFQDVGDGRIEKVADQYKDHPEVFPLFPHQMSPDQLRAAAQRLIDAVDKRHDTQEAPLKYTVPYAEVTDLRRALMIPPRFGAPQPKQAPSDDSAGIVDKINAARYLHLRKSSLSTLVAIVDQDMNVVSGSDADRLVDADIARQEKRG